MKNFLRIEWDRTPVSISPRMKLIALGVISLLLLIYFVGLPLRGDTVAGKEMDGYKYLHMAEGHIGSFHIAPFCWRIGTPLLAGISPLPDRLDFQLIGFIALLLSGYFIFKTALLLSRDFQVSLASTALLFTTGVIFHRSGAWFSLVDPMVVLAFSLSVWFSFTQRPGWFVAVIMVGVFFKEATLAAAPVYYLVNGTKTVDVSNLLPSFLAGLAGLFFVLALRYAIPAYNGDPAYEQTLEQGLPLNGGTYNVGNLMQNFGSERLQKLWQIPIYWAQTFGVLSFLILAGMALKPAVLRLLVPIFAILSVQLLFASDTHRLLSIGFPFVIVAVVPAMVRIANFSRRSLPLLVALSFLIVLIRVAMIAPVYHYSSFIFLVESNLLLATLLAAAWYPMPVSRLGQSGPQENIPERNN